MEVRIQAIHFDATAVSYTHLDVYKRQVCIEFAHVCSVLGMIELSIMVTGISQRGAIV